MDIQTTISTLTAIGEFTKMIVAGNIDKEVQAKASELYDSILSLQTTVFSIQSQNKKLLDEKHALENEIMKMANWEQEARRYRLHQLCPGVFVYAFKEDPNNAEPSHYICSNCHQEKRKSILQCSGPTPDGTFYQCHHRSCGAKIHDYENGQTPRFHSF